MSGYILSLHNAQKRIHQLEAENESFRSMLAGMGVNQVDGIASGSPVQAYELGRMVAVRWAEERNNAQLVQAALDQLRREYNELEDSLPSNEGVNDT